MLHDEWIEYLKRENKSRNLDQIKSYYMLRNLRRFIQIDKKLLNNKADDFIIVQSEKEFNDKCSQNAQMKTVHYLIQDVSNQNQLKWQKSNGQISTLKKYLIMNNECEESIDEEDIFQKNNEKVLIISAEPGMGKSLILDHFTQNSSVENFFIKIILNSCIDTFSATNFKERLQNKEGNLLEFVLKSLLDRTDEQEISLLKELAKEEKLILMFDGLDEVNDYKEQVIQLVDALNRDFKLKKILITTRNHLREELEDHFNTFSFNLNNFDDEDQKNFLVKYWDYLNLKHKEARATSAVIKQSAEDLIKRIKSISSQNLNQLIGIPLQTKILADIYFERVKKREDFSNLILTNIAELYNEFIESKIKIQFERTNNNIKVEKLSKRVQKLLEILKTEFYSDHTKLSSIILFDQKNQNQIDLNLDEENKVQVILEYGIIVAFKNGIPTFLHQSFAEFFLAKSCLQKINEKIKEDKELVQILRGERYFLIRKFLNDLMENDEYQKVSQKKMKYEKEDFNEEIENFCRENLISLLKYFIQDEGANLKTKNEFLIIASRYGHKDIVAFLLEKGIDVNQQNEDGSTALIEGSRDAYKEIVQLLLQDKNLEINHRDEYGHTALTWASMNGHVEIVKALLQDKNIHINQQDEVGSTALMYASERGHKEIVQMLLQDKNIEINQQSKYGYTAFMWASGNGHKEIAQFLKDKNIKKDQKNVYGDLALITASENGHKEIVDMLLQDKNIQINKQDEDGCTALMWASQEGHVEIVEMLLQHKNIKINKQDKDGLTALIYASERGHKEIVQILLKDKNIGINLQNNDGYTALMLASQNGYKEIVQMLLQDRNIKINHKDKDGETALMWASGNGHKEIVKMLLQDEKKKKNQKNIYGNLALIMASQNGHREIVEMLLQDENIEINQQDDFGYTALMWATQEGHKEIVEMLKDENIRKNQNNIYGEFALITAAEEGHKEIVQMLLQDKNIEINKQDKDGMTALLNASFNGHKEIVQMLLKNEKIQINQLSPRGYTALMWASVNGHEEIAQLLKDENIKKNQKNVYGDLALITASEKGHREIVEMLLQDKIIQINLQDDFGYTALMYASERGHKEIVQMLLKDENIEIKQQNKNRYTAIMLASEKDHKEIVHILEEKEKEKDSKVK
jgi:ankyrin repeat protein